MPRVSRRCPGGFVYHVLNRGNNRAAIFHKRGDAAAFLRILGEAKRRFPGVRLLAWCLMNNHWHLVLWPQADGEVSAFMAWLCNAHVRRYRQHYQSNGDGHIYQGRFKSFAVRPEAHDLRCVIRYVEANPLRAGLVARAEDWRWSSLRAWLDGDPAGLLDDWPVDRPANWLDIVNEAARETELERLRTSVDRGRPFGPDDWVQATAKSMGLEFTLRARGRPRKGDTQDIPPAGAAES
jgi:putative transposase